ncbi:Alpha-copaene synthase [Linum grandiflorum]
MQVNWDSYELTYLEEGMNGRREVPSMEDWCRRWNSCVAADGCRKEGEKDAAAAAAVVIGATTGGGSVDRATSASFPSPVWTDGFLDKIDLQANEKHPKYEILKEEVRKIVIIDEPKAENDDDAIADKLHLIDAVQRLGVGYHFEMEIEDSLEKVHKLGDNLFIDFDDEKGINLYHAALRFRLLRQQGFPISHEWFGKLKDNKGRFKEWLARDEKGVLSLYEAAHMAFRGEDVLDECLSFATKTLKSIKVSPSFRKQIDLALRVPAWKFVPRSLARHSIDLYSEEAQHNQKLLTFAKLDFNMLQHCHQQELRQLAELGRIIGTKVWLMFAILDDTFDSFATSEEAQLLGEAILERLDVKTHQELPDSMKKVYRVIFATYDELEKDLGNIGSTFGLEYLKQEVKKVVQSYLGEVRWCNKGQVPTLEEYMIDGYNTIGMPVICTSAFLGMGPEIATREAFEWVTNESKMMKAAAVVGRFQNDIFSRKREQKGNHPPSAVECYMEQYKATEEEAVEFLWKEISNAWKDIAEECCQKPTVLPVALTDRLLNLVRLVSLLYENDDSFTNPDLMKDHLTSLFIDPIPIPL